MIIFIICKQKMKHCLVPVSEMWELDVLFNYAPQSNVLVLCWTSQIIDFRETDVVFE